MTDNLTDKEPLSGQMDPFILDNGKKVSCMEKEFCIIKMGQFMKVHRIYIIGEFVEGKKEGKGTLKFPDKS